MISIAVSQLKAPLHLVPGLLPGSYSSHVGQTTGHLQSSSQLSTLGGQERMDWDGGYGHGAQHLRGTGFDDGQYEVEQAANVRSWDGQGGGHF